jgi:hypothetical protein
MTTHDDDTSTIRQTVPARSKRATTPVLLPGSFAPKAARLVSLDQPVTIGRAHGDGCRPDADVILPSRIECGRLLREKHGNVAAVAKAPDRQWNVVQRWLDRYGLDAGGFRG